MLGHEAKARQWMPEPLALYIAQQVANGLSHAYRMTENGKPITPEQMELSRLRAENARLRMEMEIVKKAAAYFAKESL